MPDSPPKGKGLAISDPEPIDEKAVTALVKDEAKVNGNELFAENDRDSDDLVIVTGADVAAHLLPLRDDLDPTLTFRAAILGSGLAAFLAVMTQIYSVSKLEYHLTLHCHSTANRYIPSSNQPKSIFQVFSLFLFPTFSVPPGPDSFPVVTSSRRGGGNEVSRASCLGGLLSSSL